MSNDDKMAAALAYRNDDVIARFLKLYDIPKEEAEELFAETLKFMWLGVYHLPIGVFPELLMLDEMWHNFILFTKAYDDYCDTHYGRMLHHSPQTVAESDDFARRFNDEREATKAEYLADYERQLTTTADVFGEETVVRWHVEFRNRYDEDFFRDKRKVPFTLARIDPTLGD